MTKVAVIADTHWGARGDLLVFHETMRKFVDSVLLPTLTSRKITTLIHCGDLVDRRKYINFQTANALRQDFLEPLQKHGITTHIIAGNHDIYYKNTNDINALDELIGTRYPNIRYYLKPTLVDLHGYSALFHPWQEKLELQLADYCFGHFAIVGFQMHAYTLCQEGISANLFSPYRLVLCGHFHPRSRNGNILYVGSPFVFMWGEHTEARGLTILDLDTGEVEFVRNPYQIFHALEYKPGMEHIPLSDFAEAYSNTFVRLYIDEKYMTPRVEKFLKQLESVSFASLTVQVRSDQANSVASASVSEVAQSLTIPDLIRARVSDERLSTFMLELYHTATTCESDV